MKFEAVLNGITMMSTEDIDCIPDEDQISSMIKAGYKFRIDGKIITPKKIKEFMEECEKKERNP